MFYNVFNDAIDKIKDWFQSLLENLVYRLLYLIETVILRILKLVEDSMMVFTGERTVTYNTEDTTLIDVFFNHGAIRGIYTGIAIIGIMFAFAFAIIAVVRKIGDLRDKQQGVTLGGIIGNLLKSILLIVGMNAIMIVALSVTNVLTRSVSEAITNNNVVADDNKIVFTDEMYAAMGRVINTIGNYSLNPSWRSRYNLNACYNDIRGDLQFLAEKGVFNFHYVSYNDKKEVVPTWQSVMEELAAAYDYREEAMLDAYDDGLTNALLNAMDILRANPTMMVLKSYERKVDMETKDTEVVPMDRIIFLIGTMGTVGDQAAARNSAYNYKPDFFDSVRQPFYYGEKSIYKWDDVKAAFNPSPAYMNYILVYVISIAILMEMLVIIVTCAVRLFNLLALYIASPLVISAMPLDDGGKFKQWTTAFIVQLLGVVGMVLSMRLFLMFLPIVWGSSLSISSSKILECIIKAVITYGGITAVNKVNSIFTGILADQAGYQAILAGDVRNEVQGSAVGRALNSVSGSAVGGAVAGAVGGAAKNMAGKWAGKAAEATGLASVGRAIRGAAEAVGIVKEHDKSKDPAHVQHTRERGRQRDMNSLKADIDYADKNHTHRDGSALKKNELNHMKATYNHMEKDGLSLNKARKLADVDMKQDDLDRKREAAEKARELPTNLRRRLAEQREGGQGAGAGAGAGQGADPNLPRREGRGAQLNVDNDGDGDGDNR